MSEPGIIDVSHDPFAASRGPSATPPLTPIASNLVAADKQRALALIGGRLTAASFAPLETELAALLQGCGVYDLGWQAHVAVRGEDRLRWLSGMVTNAVQQLPEGEGNYSFFLNAQGRIQGDAFVYREAQQLMLTTAADQVAPLIAHLDRFVIMDDVTLEDLSEQISAIAIAGPKAATLLAQFNLTPPALANSASAAFSAARLCGIPIYLVSLKAGEALRYEVWSGSQAMPTLWSHLNAAGAQSCGLNAVEAHRVLSNTPRYGVDITDRDLPQETSQDRALNFNKGCYLGQEIVERIRSRGAVHRGVRQFQLTGTAPTLPADLTAGETAIGKLTSAVTVASADGSVNYAIGIVRTEAITRGTPLTYNGGDAVALDHPPAIHF